MSNALAFFLVGPRLLELEGNIMRLDRYVCKSTELSKSEALQAIHAGEVIVNDEVITSEVTQVHKSKTITLNGERLIPRPFRYLLIHKPAGTVCSNVDEGYPSLFNLIDIEKASELHVVGRLDVDTTGLVLITDNGSWTYNIITPSKQCKKVYRVGLSRPISEDVIQKFKDGILLEGQTELTKPAELQIITPTEVILTLTEGKFHQVKRMFYAVRNKVVTLHREKVGSITLDVPLGEWRHLTTDEIDSFTP